MNRTITTSDVATLRAASAAARALRDHLAALYADNPVDDLLAAIADTEAMEAAFIAEARRVRRTQA